MKKKYGYTVMFDDSKNFKLIKTGGNDIISELDIRPASAVYVVWAKYYVGSSLNPEEHECTEPLAVFLDKELAEEFKKKIEKSKNYGFRITLSNGEILSGYIPWVGMFSRLDSINIEESIMAKGQAE